MSRYDPWAGVDVGSLGASGSGRRVPGSKSKQPETSGHLVKPVASGGLGMETKYVPSGGFRHQAITTLTAPNGTVLSTHAAPGTHVYPGQGSSYNRTGGSVGTINGGMGPISRFNNGGYSGGSTNNPYTGAFGGGLAGNYGGGFANDAGGPIPKSGFDARDPWAMPDTQGDVGGAFGGIGPGANKNTTAYAGDPGAMEGGNLDAHGAPLKTLQDYVDGKVDHVTVALPKGQDGAKGTIPNLPFHDPRTGINHNLTNLHIQGQDTGSAFNPGSKFSTDGFHQNVPGQVPWFTKTDIATGRNLTNGQMGGQPYSKQPTKIMPGWVNPAPLPKSQFGPSLTQTQPRPSISVGGAASVELGAFGKGDKTMALPGSNFVSWLNQNHPDANGGWYNQNGAATQRLYNQYEDKFNNKGGDRPWLNFSATPAPDNFTGWLNQQNPGKNYQANGQGTLGLYNKYQHLYNDPKNNFMGADPWASWTPPAPVTPAQTPASTTPASSASTFTPPQQLGDAELLSKGFNTQEEYNASLPAQEPQQTGGAFGSTDPVTPPATTPAASNPASTPSVTNPVPATTPPTPQATGAFTQPGGARNQPGAVVPTSGNGAYGSSTGALGSTSPVKPPVAPKPPTTAVKPPAAAAPAPKRTFTVGYGGPGAFFPKR